MNLFLRFKKDYFNYLISVILPALIISISVPVFKHLLGAAAYGNFSLYYNAVLIFTATTSGWITQSIYRFYPSCTNQAQFAKLTIYISGKTQFIFFLPVLFVIWYTSNNFLFAIIICLAIFFTSMQFSYMAIAQSSFLSKKTIFSETIRAVSYILISVILLIIMPHNYLYVLFIAVIISFLLAVLYLRRQTRDFLKKNETSAELTYKILLKKFFNYGAPLSFWFVFAYLLSYVDKILILKNIGAEVQGNYQAIFDLLSKGITILMMPILTSMFPLLTQAYEKGQIVEIRQLIKKIILFEIGALIAACILYWWFGASILFMILKVPDENVYRLMGLIIIAGTFIFQIAMVVHKRYELKKMSYHLLGMIAAVFVIQLIFYWIFRGFKNPLIYPLGYLIAATMYLLFVSFSTLLIFFNELIRKIKVLKKS